MIAGLADHGPDRRPGVTLPPCLLNSLIDTSLGLVLCYGPLSELMHCTIGEVRDQIHRGELPAVHWGQQFRFSREEVLALLLNDRPAPMLNKPTGVTEESLEITYERWYPDVPPVGQPEAGGSWRPTAPR